MNITNIKLIGEPDFFKKNPHMVAENNFNTSFWKFIFTPKKSGKIIDISALKSEEKEELKYIWANIETVYSFFLALGNIDIGVEKIVFCFNIISRYLEILNKFTPAIDLKFYNYILIDDQIYDNLDNNIFYYFFETETKYWLESLQDDSVVNIALDQSYQISQLLMLQILFKKYGYKNITFSISLGNLIEFENKNDIKKILEKKITNIKKINFETIVEYKVILGKQYGSFFLYTTGCSWRKCTFCNIGKFTSFQPKQETQIPWVLKKIKQNNMKHISIADPSISVSELYNFCQRVIDEKLEITIHLRCRFSKEFTPEICKVLGKAGVRYIGIGLESTSSRLNKLMGKYDQEYSKKDFSDMITLFEKNKMQLHYFTIFGFPTETKEEICDTRDFLLEHLQAHNFFTFTPGIFGLNKGTDVYHHPEKYGVEYQESAMKGEAFISNYFEKNVADNRSLLNQTLKTLINQMFFAGRKTEINMRDFWSFLEESKLLHIQKLIFNINPYRVFFLKNNTNNTEYKNNFYDKNIYVQYTKIENNYKITNWLVFSTLMVVEEIYLFLVQYDSSLTLQENMDIYTFSGDLEETSIIGELLDNYYLIQK